MKRLLGLILALALCACHRGGNQIRAQGYIEGEYLNAAAQVTGRIEAVLAVEGQHVEKGAPLIRLDPTEAQALKDRASAEFESAKATLEQSQAVLRAAARDFERKKDLVVRRVVSESTLDDARKLFETSTAQVDAAKRQMDAAQAALAQADWQLSERVITAPGTGVVDEIFYRAGEIASAGRPVLSILPPENRKVRFFVPEAELAKISLGTRVLIHCDGCSADIPARVSFIANEAEFTPPVIYSLKTRDKLVFKIEARPETPNSELKVGAPVDVLIPEHTS